MDTKSQDMKDGQNLKGTEMQDRVEHGTTQTVQALGVDERKLVRKLDLHLIPFVMLAYLLSFLDRSVSYPHVPCP